ncbi:MAG: TlpA family protein disulfide reductase [Candidatus Nanohaloarchaea archaeon]
MTLYMFYGDTCPHCEKMMPKVEELEENQDVEVEQLEVWNDEENAGKMQEYAEGRCRGVPFFFNTETEEYICGETDQETLNAWATGGEVN